jgi:hypothetical protein
VAYLKRMLGTNSLRMVRVKVEPQNTRVPNWNDSRYRLSQRGRCNNEYIVMYLRVRNNGLRYVYCAVRTEMV